MARQKEQKKPMVFVTRALNRYERAIRAHHAAKYGGRENDVTVLRMQKEVDKARRHLEKIIQDERDNWCAVFDDLLECRKASRHEQG